MISVTMDDPNDLDNVNTLGGEEIIVYAEGSDNDENDKENVFKRRQTRANNAQIGRLAACMEALDDEEIEHKQSVSWTDLSNELNDLGPPKLTAKQWSKVWSNLKYQKKRKFSDTVSDDGQSSSRQAVVENTKIKGASENFQHKILENFELVIQNQKLLLQNHEEIIENTRRLEANQTILSENQIVMSEKLDKILEKQ